MNWAEILKELYVLIVGIPIALMVAWVGQWVVEYAKAPISKRDEQTQRSKKRTALKKSLGSIVQYLEQMSMQMLGYSPLELEAIRTTQDVLDVQNKVSERFPHQISIPTFNLDDIILEKYASEIFLIANREETASALHTARLEVRHFNRRVDALTTGFGLKDKDEILAFLGQHLPGLFILLHSTRRVCKEAIVQLDLDKNAEPHIPHPYLRLAGVAVGFLVLISIVIALGAYLVQVAAESKAPINPTISAPAASPAK